MQKSKPPPPPPKPKALSSTTTTPSSRQQPGKRGLGWPWNEPSSHFPLYHPYTPSPTTKGTISWLFNWEVWVPESMPPGVEWVPTIRTAQTAREQLDGFLTDIIQNRHVHVTHLLGFNEPEIESQANLSVGEAVNLWKDVVLPVRRKFGLRLGSPGVSSDVSRSKPWLNDFFAGLGGAKGAEIEVLVVHWYGLHFGDMRSFLEDMHSTYGLPLWVNEFACSRMGNGQASAEEVEGFLREAVPWLEGCAWVERYAYFGNKDVGEWVGRESNFTEGENGLTRAAKLYCEL